MMYTACWSFTYADLKEWLPIGAHLVHSGITTSLCTFPLTQRLWSSADVGLIKKPVMSTVKQTQLEIRLFNIKNKQIKQGANVYKTYTEFSCGLRKHKNGFKKTSQAARVVVAVRPDQLWIKSPTVNSKERSTMNMLFCASVWVKTWQSECKP